MMRRFFLLGRNQRIATIPSPKAEPFKLWLAQVASERIEQNVEVARHGGNVAKVVRLELEARTGKNVVTSVSAKKTLKALDQPVRKKKN